MIIHCTLRLARKLKDVSSSNETGETSPIGSWTANLYTIDRRQCVFFCHDETRYILFGRGLLKGQFEDFGGFHRELFLASLASLGLEERQIKKILLMFGPVHFDCSTDRSVLSSMNIVRSDLEGALARVANVMELDPIETALYLNNRPAKVRSSWIWPAQAMKDRIALL